MSHYQTQSRIWGGVDGGKGEGRRRKGRKGKGGEKEVESGGEWGSRSISNKVKEG